MAFFFIGDFAGHYLCPLLSLLLLNIRAILPETRRPGALAALVRTVGVVR